MALSAKFSPRSEELSEKEAEEFDEVRINLNEFRDWFIAEFGSVVCRDVQHRQLGRFFNLMDKAELQAFRNFPEVHEKCSQVTTKAVLKVTEIVQAAGMSASPLNLLYPWCLCCMEVELVKKSFTIHDLPTSERPRERLQKLGVDALSAQEILALILGRGIAGESVMVTAQRLLSQFGNLKGIANASLEELSQVKGIGPAKASQIKAASEMANRLEGYSETGEKPVIKTPEEVVNLVKGKLKGKKKEHFLVLLLDTRNHLIEVANISVGSLDTSVVHPREVFKEAISASAASVIFVHNHPSGDPTSSEDDIKLTKRLAEVGEIMGIDVLDHIIIGDKNYLSLKREGLF